eukprot:677438-Heterocapsa_arctica.AAC.1
MTPPRGAAPWRVGSWARHESAPGQGRERVTYFLGPMGPLGQTRCGGWSRKRRWGDPPFPCPRPQSPDGGWS